MVWRALGAAALVVSAADHLKLWFAGVRHQSVGPAFLVNVVAGVVIAVLLLRWHHWVPAFLTLGFRGSTPAGAFVLATTVGCSACTPSGRAGPSGRPPSRRSCASSSAPPSSRADCR